MIDMIDTWLTDEKNEKMDRDKGEIYLQIFQKLKFLSILGNFKCSEMDLSGDRYITDTF